MRNCNTTVNWLDFIASPKRTGIAQLEFVMVLVVLIPLFLALFWSGIAGNSTLSAKTSSRHEAWRMRHETKGVLFEFKEIIQGRIERTVREPVKFVAMFDGWAVPTSTHVVYGGSWAHPQVNLNEESPNRSYMEQLAAKSGSDRIGLIFDSIGKISDIKSSLTGVPLAAADLLNQYADMAAIIQPGGPLSGKIDEAKKKSQIADSAQITTGITKAKIKLKSAQTALDEAKRELLRKSIELEKTRDPNQRRELQREISDLQKKLPMLQKNTDEATGLLKSWEETNKAL